MTFALFNSHMLLLFAALIGAALSAAGTLVLRRIAPRMGWIDRPGAHKAHAAPVALGGGIAISIAVGLPMIGAVLGAFMWASGAPDWLPHGVAIHLGGIQTKTPLALAIVGAVAVMCAMGFWDDLRPLGPRIKLLVELVVALVLVIGFNLRLLSHFGSPISITLTVLWILTLTNSLNFLDNMDGLSPGVAMIASSIFAFAALRDGQVFVPACCALLAGALAGFLPFNFHPALIFMGDAGSLVVGMLLAVFTILTTFADPSRGQSPIGVFAPVVVMAVPLYDTLSVIFLRWRAGSPIWTGDRRHFSHRLVQRGMSVRQAVCVIWLATLVTALPSLMLATASWLVAWGIALQTVMVIALVALLESSGSRDTTRT